MITTNVNGNPISQGFIAEIQSDSPNLLARLWYNNAEVPCDIVNITIEKGSCGQQTFMVGDVIGDILTATVKDLSTDIKNEVIECHVGALVNGSYEFISLGQFRVSEVKKTRYQSEITAYSSVVADTGTRLDTTGLSSPTIAQIASKIAGKLGCTITFDTGINTSLVVGAQLDGITYYQALQIIAICSGGYVVNTNDGNVRVKKFDTASTLSVDTGMMVNLPEFAEQPYEVDSVGVLVSEATVDNNGNEVAEIFYSDNPSYIIVTKQGTDYYLKDQNGDYILANLKPETADVYFSCPYMTEAIFSTNVKGIKGYTYSPATVGLTLGDPRLEGCDVLTVTDVDESTYTVPCHKVVHKYDGGFTSEITACDASDKANSIGTSFPITQRLETQSRQIGTAQATAENAYKVANDTNQYFWFTGSGSDTGAHITETPQDQFIADPQNGGGNLLARSNGVAIRDGLEELAIFSADQLRIGRLGAQRAMVNSGSMELYDAEGNKYFVVSADGMTFGDNSVASQQYVDDAEAEAKKVATDYVTKIDNNGIYLSPSSQSPTSGAEGNSIKIDGNGMEIYKGNVSVAKYGDSSARIGATSTYNVYEDATGIAFREGSADKFKINATTEGYYNVANLASKTEYSMAQYTSYVSADSIVAGYALSRIEAIAPNGSNAPYANVTARRDQNEASVSLISRRSDSTSVPYSSMYLVSSDAQTHVTITSDEINLYGDLYNNGAPVNPLKITKTSVSSLPVTISNSAITIDMEVIHSVLSNPSAQTGDWTVTTTGVGTLQISGSISGTTNITLYLAVPST